MKRSVSLATITSYFIDKCSFYRPLPVSTSGMLGLFSLFIVLCVLPNHFVCSNDLVLYAEVQPANTSESLDKIRQLPVVHYKFLFDSVPDRVQLGVIGPDAQRLFPESIDVLPSTAFAKRTVNADGESEYTTVTVTNFPVVDKNVIFMHGVAAIKELIVRYEHLNRSLHDADAMDLDLERRLESLREHINKAASQAQEDRLNAAKQELELANHQLEQEKRRSEQELQRVAQQLENEKSLLELEESLARERLVHQEEMSKVAMAKQLDLERELAERKDALQRQNTEALQALKTTQTQELDQKRVEMEKEKIMAEIEAKVAQDKIDAEIALKKLQLQAKLDTDRMVMGIKSVSTHLSSIINSILSHPEQLAYIAGLFLVVVACYFGIRELITMLRDFVQRRIGKPTLVRETSYHLSILPEFLSHWFESTKVDIHLKKLETAFAHVILSAEDKGRVISLAYATRNTRKAGAPFRHVLLHGPPGTGKTLIARTLAKCSGMDYAILSGGDITPLGEDAVNQLHALFNWAKRSKKGLLVFIDEAEAFLSSRTNSYGDGSNDSNLRNALNALLYQTGTPSQHFMMVLATNRPEDLDSAVLDRIDVSLHIGLPAEQQRIDLIGLYLKLHIQKVTESTTNNGILQVLFGSKVYNSMDTDCLSADALQFLAKVTDGFSGREISKLCVSAQYAMYLAPNRTLTWQVLKRVVLEKVAEHQEKFTGFRSYQDELVEEDTPVESTSPKKPRKGEGRINVHSTRKW